METMTQCAWTLLRISGLLDVDITYPRVNLPYHSFSIFACFHDVLWSLMVWGWSADCSDWEILLIILRTHHHLLPVSHSTYWTCLILIKLFNTIALFWSNRQSLNSYTTGLLKISFHTWSQGSASNFMMISRTE